MCEARETFRVEASRVTTWLVICLLALGAGLAHAASPKPNTKVSPADEFFSDTNTSIPRLQIEIPAQAMQKLRGRGWGWGGGGRDRPEVQVTVREGQVVYTNVALHLKGSAGSFQPIESKPALTLTFDKSVKGQRFHGLNKLSLNNSVQDPTFFTEKICRELFNAAGVPAPRANFATVDLNGRKLGFYVLVEAYNRQFLKRHFKNPDGNLYDGGFLRDIDSPLATAAQGNPNDPTDLRALLAAAHEQDRTKRFARLEKLLDMDRFITFIAMEVLVCHWDGYALNKNNYRVYHDLDTNRILFFPHGMDQMFGTMMTDARMSIRPPMQGLIARAVMDTSEGRRRSYERLTLLNSRYFPLESLTNRIYQLSARINPVLSEISPTAVEDHEREAGALVDRIIQRKESLDEQLTGGPGNTLVFDGEGVAQLKGWVATNNFGSPRADEELAPDGKPLLHLSAERGSSIASWRTQVLLEDGHYSFEARMKIKGVVSDPIDRRAGAGLRISGRPAARKTQGDAGWTNVVYEFDVPDGIHDIELVCELRAAKGDAWFESESLKLVRK